LIYYATANLCALRQPSEERRYPRLVSICGLVGCLGLIPFVDSKTLVGGIVLMMAGLIVKLVADFQKRKHPVT
jgi:basic amino acid/polyamine antiporter, APA family